MATQLKGIGSLILFEHVSTSPVMLSRSVVLSPLHFANGANQEATMKLRVLVIFVAFAAGIAGGLEAAAQVSGGTIAGTVTDQTGAIVQNEHVTIVDTATSIARDVTANNDGAFSAPSLTPGHYDATAQAPGFKTEVQTNLQINVGAVKIVNFILTVGAATEKIEVTTINAPIELGSSQLSGVVS